MAEGAVPTKALHTTSFVFATPADCQSRCSSQLGEMLSLPTGSGSVL